MAELTYRDAVIRGIAQEIACLILPGTVLRDLTHARVGRLQEWIEEEHDEPAAHHGYGVNAKRGNGQYCADDEPIKARQEQPGSSSAAP